MLYNLYIIYCYDDHITQNEMRWAFSTHNHKYIHIFVRKTEESPLGRPELDGRIILKWIVKK
jgi:hypothetical protein